MNEDKKEEGQTKSIRSISGKFKSPPFALHRTSSESRHRRGGSGDGDLRRSPTKDAEPKKKEKHKEVRQKEKEKEKVVEMEQETQFRVDGTQTTFLLHSRLQNWK